MKIITEEDISDEEKLKYDKLIRANEKEWESGDYGRNEQYMERASPHDEKKINRIIGKKKIQKTYSIKMPEDLVDTLKLIASKKHIGYQTLIKIISSEYIEKWFKLNQQKG